MTQKGAERQGLTRLFGTDRMPRVPLLFMRTRSRKKMAQLFSRTRLVGSSGDPLVDWIFRQFVAILRTERVRIVRKKRLVNPDDPHRRVIRGLMDPDADTTGLQVHILINSAKNTHRNRDAEVETLIHELAHIIFPKASERHVLSIENILSKRLPREQLDCLKAFLPRHEVKRYPGAAVSGRLATA